MLTIHQIINTPVSSNCYIIFCSERDKCIIIDPGSSKAISYLEYLAKNALTPQFIILTHQHFDHCASVNELRAVFPDTKLVCSKYCNVGIQNEKKNFSLFKEEFAPFKIAPADIVFENYGTIEWNDYRIQCVPTRGHTSGSISVIIENNIFTGDAWIKDTPTFTNFPTGNKEEQMATEKYLHSLHGMKVWPGHGDCFVVL